MPYPPPVGWADVATKRDLDSGLESLRQELRAEIHRVARGQLIAFITVVGILNGITFAALRFA